MYNAFGKLAIKRKSHILLFSLIILSVIICTVLASTKFIKANEGGTVELSRGVYLEIPENSLTEDTKIHAHMSSRKIKDKNDDKKGKERLVFDFKPDGTTFDPPAELHIPKDLFYDYDGILINEIGDEYGEPAEVDEDTYEDKVVVFIEHFSYYYYPRR